MSANLKPTVTATTREEKTVELTLSQNLLEELIRKFLVKEVPQFRNMPNLTFRFHQTDAGTCCTVKATRIKEA